jgi:hypothetical protein
MDRPVLEKSGITGEMKTMFFKGQEFEFVAGPWKAWKMKPGGIDTKYRFF